MQDMYSNTDKVGDIGYHFSELNDDQIFSFLKRYYNDLCPTLEDRLQTKLQGVYFETIETLERLHRCLITVSDFIGYARIDWHDACTAQKKIKIKEIVAFYNDLVIDIDLMKAGMNCYDFAPRVRAFINFVAGESNCIFRFDVQKQPWTIDDFPHDEIFQIIDQFKQCFEKQKKSYRLALIKPEWKEQAKSIEEAISTSKRITQALYVIKFSVADFSKDELAELALDPKVNSILADLSSPQKLKELIEWLSLQHIDDQLPWLCTWTKAEIDLRRQIQITIGMILDATDNKLEPKMIERMLSCYITQQLEERRIEPFIVFEIVQLDQIFDQLGFGVVRYIKLPNKRKVALMLKWYLGIFYQLSTIIQPSNLEAETSFADGSVNQEIKRRKLENIKHEPERRKRSRIIDKVGIRSNWSPIKLLKQVPAYFSSIHFFYEGLKHCEVLKNIDIEKLQNLNLFIAYLETTCLDNLQDMLKITKPQKWTTVVQLYLLLLRDWDKSYLQFKDLAVCDLEPLDRGFREKLAIRYIKDELESEESLKMIAYELGRLKRELLNQDKVTSLKSSMRLVEKNSRFALEYLNHSFRQNSALLRFKIDNFESSLELSELKNLFTQFIKSSGRAPKRIGAKIDAYIGYYIFDGKGYSIDCTAIFYLRDNVYAKHFQENLEDYWQEFKNKYADTKQLNLSQLDLLLIPTLWSKEGEIDSLVVNQGDKLIPCLKKDLVRFYTAYEYIRGYKNTRSKDEKRSELFLRGRVRKSAPKGKGAKKTQQLLSIVQSFEGGSLIDDIAPITDYTIRQPDIEIIEAEGPRNDKNSNVVVDDQQQKEWDIIDKIKREKVQRALARLRSPPL